MAKNNKIRFFCVLYSDKTWVFDQSVCAQGPIYITTENTLLVNFKGRVIQYPRGTLHIRYFQFFSVDCTNSKQRDHRLLCFN